MKNRIIIGQINSLRMGLSNIISRSLYSLKQRQFDKIGSKVTIKVPQSVLLNRRFCNGSDTFVSTDKIYNLIYNLLENITSLLKKTDLSKISNGNYSLITNEETELFNAINHLMIINKSHIIEKIIKELQEEKDNELDDFFSFDFTQDRLSKNNALYRHHDLQDLIDRYSKLQSCSRLLLDNFDIQRFYFEYRKYKQIVDFPFQDTIGLYSSTLDKYKSELCTGVLNENDSNKIDYVFLYNRLSQYRSKIIKQPLDERSKKSYENSFIRFYYEYGTIERMISQLESLESKLLIKKAESYSIDTNRELTSLHVIINAYKEMYNFIENSCIPSNGETLYKKAKS